MQRFIHHSIVRVRKLGAQSVFAHLSVTGKGLTLASCLVLSSCMQDALEEPGDPNPQPQDSTPVVAKESVRRVYFTASDYQSGLLLSLDLDSLKAGPDSLEINQDSRVLTHGKDVYILEAFGADNWMKYDPQKREVVYQNHLGDHANPVDMAFIHDSDAILVTENVPWLYRCNPKTGKLTDSLDLSEFIFHPDSGAGNAASSPHAFAVAVRGDTAWVGLQRRNGDWQYSGGLSQVALIDLKAFSLLGHLESGSTNASQLFFNGPDLYLLAQGKYGVLNDGGLYRWHNGRGESETVVDGSKLDGDPGDIACDEKGHCLVSLAKTFGSTGVYALDLKAGTLGQALSGLMDASGGIVRDDSLQVWVVGERGASHSGAVVFDSNLKQKGEIFPMALPPYSQALLAF